MRQTGGDDAVQDEWKRIWIGFVAVSIKFMLLRSIFFFVLLNDFAS